jgi:hypothetical protein
MLPTWQKLLVTAFFIPAAANPGRYVVAGSSILFVVLSALRSPRAARRSGSPARTDRVMPRRRGRSAGPGRFVELGYNGYVLVICLLETVNR